MQYAVKLTPYAVVQIQETIAFACAGDRHCVGETVWVTPVVYARRDQLNALKDMPQ